MAMRSIDRLLVLVKAQFIKNKPILCGLCSVNESLYEKEVITYVEMQSIKSHIENFAPLRNFYCDLTCEEFSWNPADRKSRIEWLDTEIRKHQSKIKIINKLLRKLFWVIIFEKDFAGMCITMGELIDDHKVNGREFISIINYIGDNKPKNSHNLSYYWKCGRKIPRLLWILKHILLTLK